MKVRRLAVVGVAIATVFGAATACLQPGQHTLVGITSAHNSSNNLDIITFVFDQGAPTGSSATYVNSPPAGPSGKPVGIDGAAFVKVDLFSAVARDARNVETASQAVYPRNTRNVVEVAQYEDFEGHVGYALGLLSKQSSVVNITRTATTVVVAVLAR